MRKAFLISLLALTACSHQDKHEVNNKYLTCYALDPEAKKQCLKELQFESEKIAFKKFITNLGLPCKAVNEGPVFAKDKEAYIVTCSPSKEYLMRFNYEAKKWNLIKEGE